MRAKAASTKANKPPRFERIRITDSIAGGEPVVSARCVINVSKLNENIATVALDPLSAILTISC